MSSIAVHGRKARIQVIMTGRIRPVDRSRSAESSAREPGDCLMADLTHPKLVVAIIVAIIAVAAIWVSVFIARWRRITWRDQMDAKLGALASQSRDSGHWAVWKVLTHHEEVAQPSMVLLRIRNSGLGRIRRADVRQPLTFTFPGRVVKEVTVTDCRGVSRQEIQPPGEMLTPVEDTISLPRFPLRRKAGFKLLVLLGGPGTGIAVGGRLRRGSVRHESRGPGPLTQNVVFGSVILLLFGIQAGITFSQAATLPTYCASGRLALSGSTAFAPTAQEIASAYTAACHGAAISVSATATFNGLNAVVAQGSPQPSSAGDPPAEQMAMSDGPKPSGYSSLTGDPVAVILFAVVVNSDTKVYNLSTAQLRGIFLGKITNWKQVGGPDWPIRIVARTTASGTRATFDRKILGGQAEPPFSSYNCTSKNAVPSSPFIRCEVTDTGTLLQRVNSIQGAIGYAQISDASAYPNVTRVNINGQDATLGAVKAGSYPYWTVEYLYTAGVPAPGTLAADFLQFVQSVTASDILLGDEYTPCIDRGRSLALCTSDKA
jgi:phosphate transport system substrate-binding protein